MKRIKFTLNRGFLLMVLGILILFTTSTCKLFELGLGDKVDIEPPSLEITSHSNGDYVKGVVRLSGTAIDDLAIASVKVSVAGTAARDVEEIKKSGTWSIDLSTTAFSDGEKEIVVVATDEAGKSQEKRILLFFDNKPPTVLLTSPDSLGEGNRHFGVIQIKGEAADQTRIRSVVLEVYRKNTSQLLKKETFSGTTNFAYSFDTTAVSDDLYYFNVIATDFAGNTNSYFYHIADLWTLEGDASNITIEDLDRIDNSGVTVKSVNIEVLKNLRKSVNPDSNRLLLHIDQAYDRPYIELSNLQYDGTISSNVLGVNPRIIGRVSDDDGVRSSSLEITLSSDWGGTWSGWTAVNGVAAGDARAVDWFHDLGSSGANLEQGVHLFKLRVYDIHFDQDKRYSLDNFSWGWLNAGGPNRNKDGEGIVFVIDFGPPNLNLDFPAAGSIHKQDISVQGTTSDPNGVQKIELFIGQDLVDSLVIPYEGKSAEEILFNLTVPVGTGSGKFGNGTYNLKVRSTDFANASFDIDRQIIIDITPPVVTFLEPPVDSIVKGKTVTIRGESSDNVAVSKVYLWQGPSSTAPGPVSTWGQDAVLAGTYVWSKIIDTTVEYQAPYSVWVAAEDTAGNVSVPSELTLQVDQERDRPLIELTNMEPTGTYQQNALLTASGAITGTVEDDDRVKAGSVEINISSDGGSTWSGWTAVSKQSANDSTLLSWSHDVSGLSQGAHLFNMRVRDANFTGDLQLAAFPVENYNWGWTGAGGANIYKEGVSPSTPNLTGIPFMIDHGPPILSITAPENNSIKKETFTISGTAQDANGISKIEVKIPGQIDNYTDIINLQNGSILPPNNGIGGVYSWSFGFTVQTGGATDGDWKYYIRAVDGSGASTEQERLVRVDATPPSVGFIYPAEAQELNETIVVRGTSADNRQIERVLLFITPTGSNPSQDDADWILPEGTYSWNYSWNTKLHPQGAYTLHLKAYDLAGNQSPAAALPVIINQESDRPVISLTNLATEGDFKENLFESNPRILGIITDDDGVKVNTIEIRTRKAINHFTGEWQNWGSWSPVTTRPAVNTTNAEWSHNLTSLGQGFFQFELRVQDINFTGNIENPAADNYNWNSLGTVKFAVDTTPPAVTITNPAQNGYYKTDFTLQGGAGDTNGLALWDHDGNTLTAQVPYVEVSTDNELTWAKVTVDQSGIWNYLVTDLWDGSAEGSKNYKIKATDYFGKSTIGAFIFTVDTQGPEVVIDLPGESDWLTGSSYAAGGTALDLTSLVSAVYWSLNGGTNWNTANGTSQWTAGLNLDSLPEGQLSLSVKAVDAAGNESLTVTRAFGNDKNPPSVTEERVGTGSIYRNSSFSLGDGFLTDTNGVTRLLVVQNRVGVSIDTIVDDSGLSGTSIPLVLENLPRNPAQTSELLLENGVYEYSITVFDVAGKQASLTRTVTVDTTSPTVEFTSVVPVVGENEVNGEITFSVSAIDENGLSGVKYWILPSPSVEPDYDAPLGISFAGPPYRLTLDTKSLLANNTSYDIWAVAKDRAGNVGSESYNFLVNQESDRPEISLTNMTVEGGFKDNLLESNPRILGLITDDDGVKVDTIEIRTRKAVDPYSGQWGAWSAWGLVSTRPTVNTASANWSHNLSGLGQGFFQFELRVQDTKFTGDPENPGAENYNWNSLGPVNFAVDTAFPAINFTSPGQNSFQKGIFTLSGTVSDANGLDLWDHDADSGTDSVAYVELKRNGEETWERITVSGGIWNYAVTGFWDGSKEGARILSVKGADYFGKETVTVFNFTVDTVAPTIPVISSPLSTDWLSGATGTATGTAADAGGSGVNLVEWSTDGINWNPAVGTTSWNLSLNLIALGEGTKTLYVRATDRAGNVGTGAALGIAGFGIDQSNPTAEETAFGAPSGLRSQIFSLVVRAEDTNNLSEIVVTQEKIGDAEGEVEIFQESVSGKIVERSITGLPRKPEEPEISLLTDGRYLYKIMVTDVAGKPTSQPLQREVTVDLTGPEVTIASPVPGQKISGTAFTVGGSVADFENVSPISEVRYWVGALGEEPPLSVLDWLQATGGASFSATVNLELLGEGDKTLHVLAKDGAGNWSGTTLSPKEVDFMVDQSAPTLSGFSFSEEVVLVNGINYAREGFTLGVTAGDSNRISGVTLMEIRNNGTHQAVTWATGNSGEKNRTLTSPLLPLEGASDGIYEYIITVTDAADKFTQITRTVTVDITPPAVEITSINPMVGTNFVNGMVTITASGIDANGLEGLRWWILPQGAEDPEYGTEGGVSFGQAPFTVTKDTTDGTLLNGEYRLWVIGKDRAGNETGVNRSIQIDQTSDLPQAGFTDLDPAVGTVEGASDNLLETNPRIRGTLSDDDSVDAASIRIALNQSGDPSGWEWLTVTPTGGSGREVGFEYSLSSLAEGTHWFSLKFSDLTSAKNGKEAVTETVGPVYFVIDKNVPTVTVTSPAAGAVKNNDFLIEGTAWDANGLKVWDHDGNSLTDKVPYVEVSTDNGTNWEEVKVDEEDGTWSYSVIGLWDGDHEGTKNYRIRATDIFGKVSEVAPVYSFKVDTIAPAIDSITAPLVTDWLSGATGSAAGTARDESGSGVMLVEWSANGTDWNSATGTTNWNVSLDLFSLGEGEKTLYFRAIDYAGNVGSGEKIGQIIFGIDQTNPEILSLNVGTGAQYRNSDFTLSFTAKDQLALKRIIIKENDLEIYNQETGLTEYAVNLEITTGLEGLEDNTYEYEIIVTDISGKSIVANRIIILETEGPEIEFNIQPPVTDPSELFNERVNLRATIIDDNPINLLYRYIGSMDSEPEGYTVVKNSSGVATEVTGLTAGWEPYSGTNKNTWLENYNTRELTVTTGTYYLWLLAVDRLGNIGTERYTLPIDQSTDLPVITVSSPSVNGFAGTNYTVRGTVADDDGVDTENVYIQYDTSGDGSAWSDWNKATVTGTGKTVNFSYNLPSGLGSDGVKQIRVYAQDDAERKLGDAFATGYSAPVPFILDTLAPAVSFSSPDNNSSQGSSFMVEGSIVEANLDTLRISLNFGTFQEINLDGSTWSFSITFSLFDSLNEGPNTIIIEAVDKVGQIQTRSLIAYKDTTGPEINFTNLIPGENTLITEALPVLRGNFSDEYSNISGGFEYRLNSVDPEDEWTPRAITTTGRTINWSVPVDHLLFDGENTIDLRISDISGNSRAVYNISFRIDRWEPEIEFSIPEGAIYNTLPTGPIFELEGTASDATLNTLEYKIDTENYELFVGDISEWTYVMGKVLFDTLSEGEHSITIMATDEALRTKERSWSFIKDSLLPEISINNLSENTVLQESNPKILGSITDGSGILSMESRIEKFESGSWVLAEGWTALDTPGGAKYISFEKILGPTGLNLTDGLYRVEFRSSDLSLPANEKILPLLQFRIDRANPTLSLSNPSLGSFQKGNFNVAGTAGDLNGITEVLVKIDSSDFSTGATLANTSNGYANWTVTGLVTTGLSLDVHTLYIRAKDGANRETVITRDFTFDNELPSINISEPVSKTRVNGRVIVKGSSSDNNAIKTVQYRIGKNASNWNTADLAGGVYSWSYQFDNINDYANTLNVTEINYETGEPEEGTNIWALPFQVRVTDVSDNITEELNYLLYIAPDMDIPEVTIVSPEKDQIVGGSVRVFGFASDDDWVKRVEMAIDPTGTGTSFGEYLPVTMIGAGTQVNWFKNINESGEYNPPPGEIRDIRIRVRAVDSKDFGSNDGITGDYKEINIKFDSAIPVIENILIIPEFGDPKEYAPGVRASGLFTISALVKDEGGIASITKKGEGESVAANILNNPDITTPPVEITAGNFQKGIKYLITYLGNTVWTDIGATSDDTLGISFTAIGEGSGTGKAYKATAPIIDAADLVAGRTYTVYFVGNTDWIGLGAFKDEVGETFVANGSGSGTGTAIEPNFLSFVYQINLEVDSNTINSGQYADTSGFYSLEFSATDNATPSPYRTQTNLNIQIDNYYPDAEYLASPNAATSNYKFQGRATDVGPGSGNIQGIEKVVLYLYRNDEFIDLVGGTGNWTTQLVKNNENEGSIEEVVFPKDKFSGITIDINEITTDLDGDGYIESFTDDGVYKNWWVFFDTGVIADGPVDIYYVVFDRAGNATLNVQPLYIRNHTPSITGVVLGTDVNGDGEIGNIFSGESRNITINYRNTNFTVRNNTLSFTVSAINGNSTKRYSLGYVTATNTIDAIDIVKGKVYTIDDPGTTNWISLGAPNNEAGTVFVATAPGSGTGKAIDYTIDQYNSEPYANNVITISGEDFQDIPDTTGTNNALFIIKVYDTTVPTGGEYDQLADAVIIGMNIDNIDSVPPNINIAPFGKRYTQQSQDIQKVLTPLANYTDNLVMNGSIPLGKVQYAQHSLHNNPDDVLDADVSGQIILKGRVYDNQRISSITVQIPGFDPDGTGELQAGDEFTVYSYSEGEKSSGDDRWSFIAEGPISLTEDNGHLFNWNFQWNTARISNVAENNVTLTFRVYDFGTSDPAEDEITVDIVPYITDVITGLDTGTQTFLKQSSTGKYPVNINDTIAPVLEIRGFNLNPGTGEISLGTETYTPSSVDTTDYTWVKLNKIVLTASGNLSVLTNSIESINNSNNNDAYLDSNGNNQYDVGETKYNREAKQFFPNLTDNRAILLWEINNRGWAGRTEAVMKPNRNTSGNKTGTMDWMFVNNGQIVQFNGNPLSNSWTLLGGDFAYNSVGNLMYIFLHNMNWQSGNDNYNVHGSVQWGKGTDNEGLAANWHRANQDRLGVGNLSFVNDPNYGYDNKTMARYENLRIEVAGNNTDTYNFVVYFDNNTESRSLVFWSFRTGTGLTGGDRVTTMDNDAATWYSNLEKITTGNTGLDYAAGTNTNTGLRTPSTGIRRTEITSGNADSNFFDIKYDSTRTNLYLVYYDEANSSLVVRYNNNPMTDRTGWSSPFPVDAQAGQYNRLVLDSSGRMHIAYFDAVNSALKYALITPSFDGSNNINGLAIEKKVTIDTMFTNGMYNSISLRDFGSGDIRPVISTYSITYGGTRSALRLSYPVTNIAGITDGTNVETSEYTGAWETVAVRTNVAAGQNPTFVETAGTGEYTGEIVVGYNGSSIEQAVLKAPY